MCFSPHHSVPIREEELRGRSFDYGGGGGDTERFDQCKNFFPTLINKTEKIFHLQSGM